MQATAARIPPIPPPLTAPHALDLVEKVPRLATVWAVKGESLHRLATPAASSGTLGPHLLLSRLPRSSPSLATSDHPILPRSCDTHHT